MAPLSNVINRFSSFLLKCYPPLPSGKDEGDVCFTIQHGDKDYVRLTINWGRRNAAGNSYILSYELYRLRLGYKKENYSSYVI